jgi:hypothetical protein
MIGSPRSLTRYVSASLPLHVFAPHRDTAERKLAEHRPYWKLKRSSLCVRRRRERVLMDLAPAHYLNLRIGLSIEA